MTTPVNLSNNPDVDGVVHGSKWDTKNLTYSFPTNTGIYKLFNVYGYQDIQNFQPLNSSWKNAFTDAMKEISNFSKLTFTASNNPEMRFASADIVDYGVFYGPGRPGDPPSHTIVAGEATYPDAEPAHATGDIWFSNNQAVANVGSDPGYFWIIHHELGHALGLKHGQDTEETHRDGNVTFLPLPFDHNSSEYSLMTYRAYVGEANDSQWGRDRPTTYMQSDIAALQYLYGANYNYRSDNTTYKWNPSTGELSVNNQPQGASPYNSKIFMTIWDGGGNDTYDFSNYNTNIRADLRPGNWINLNQQLADLSSGHMARGNIANALLDPNNPREVLSLIENVIGGAGNDNISGNSVDNYFVGGRGNDIIRGYEGNDIFDQFSQGEGRDTFYGGTGDDKYYIGTDGGDTIVEMRQEGTDHIFSPISYNLIDTDGVGRNGGNVENLTLLGNLNINATGNPLNNSIWGNRGNNIIVGAGGNDILNGLEGNDRLYGGPGIDKFVFNTAATPGNADTIYDFVAGSEKIILATSIYTAFRGGNVVSSQNFRAGNNVVANDANDYLLYDTTTHNLYYDVDGSGSTFNKVLIGTILIEGTRGISSSDFELI